MPTIARLGPYRFFFFSNEGEEPPHIHVQRDRCVAKFWLRPVHLASSWGYDEIQINRIYRLVREHRFVFLSAWNEFHGHQ